MRHILFTHPILGTALVVLAVLLFAALGAILLKACDDWYERSREERRFQEKVRRHLHRNWSF